MTEKVVSRHQNHSIFTKRQGANTAANFLNEMSKRLIDKTIFNSVIDAVSSVIQKKQLLEKDNISSNIETQSHKLSRSDIREIFRELKILKQFENNPKGRASLPAEFYRVSNQNFKDQETLIDQIEALFFTNQVRSIEFTYI